MAIRSRISSKSSGKRYYAFVDDVAPADPENKRSRSSIRLDAIDADAFDADPTNIDRDEALAIVRISSTPGRLAYLFGIDTLHEGDWVEIRLLPQESMPLTWHFSYTSSYTQYQRSNIVSLSTIAEAPTASIRARLTAACKSKETPRLNLEGQDDLLSPLRGLKEIVAVDVGQAACISFHENFRCVGYFDVGAPLFSNKHSCPNHINHQFATEGFVILSHWDFDHFSLAYKHPLLKSLDWLAPEQRVGPNTAKFQKSLGTRLRFMSGKLETPYLMLAPCLGADPLDRNSTGYALRVKIGEQAVLLTGDADYQWIDQTLKSNLTGLVIPHHGAAGANPPRPALLKRAVAVASYGNPNCYRHPNETFLADHKKIGWQVQRTAKFGMAPIQPRGNRQLYPV